MNKKNEKIVSDFSSIQWHDSQVLNFQISPVQNSMACRITINLHMPHKFYIGKIQTNHCKVIYDDCTFLGCNLDIFYLMWNRLSIDSAKFYKTMSEINEKFVIQRIEKYAGLTQKYEDEMWFFISLMFPGGEIVISARNFKIKGLTEIK